MPYADPGMKREYQRQWSVRRRASFFAGQACEWCGATDDLELHHRDPNQKVSHRIWSWSASRREAEIAKCIVLCGSCHDRAHSEARSVEAALRHPCGTVQSFWRGCFCPECRAARNDYERQRRAAREPGSET